MVTSHRKERKNKIEKERKKRRKERKKRRIGFPSYSVLPFPKLAMNIKQQAYLTPVTFQTENIAIVNRWVYSYIAHSRLYK